MMNSSWVINVKVLIRSVLAHQSHIHTQKLCWCCLTRAAGEPSPPCPDICAFLRPPGLFVYERGPRGAAQYLKPSLRSPALPVAASASWHPGFAAVYAKQNSINTIAF